MTLRSDFLKVTMLCLSMWRAIVSLLVENVDLGIT